MPKPSDYLAWVKTLPCAVCGGGPSEPDHHPTRGAAGNHERVWPLCRRCHTFRHTVGIKTFLARHGLGTTDDLERYITGLREVFDAR